LVTHRDRRWFKRSVEAWANTEHRRRGRACCHRPPVSFRTPRVVGESQRCGMGIADRDHETHPLRPVAPRLFAGMPEVACAAAGNRVAR
jgi:hypothetical protein